LIGIENQNSRKHAANGCPFRCPDSTVAQFSHTRLYLQRPGTNSLPAHKGRAGQQSALQLSGYHFFHIVQILSYVILFFKTYMFLFDPQFIKFRVAVLRLNPNKPHKLEVSMEYLGSVLLWLTWPTTATFLLCYFTGLAFYRLFIHPLARFPGPKLAAVTRWFETYYDVVQNGQYTFKIQEMHKKYGILLSEVTVLSPSPLIFVIPVNLGPIIRISPHGLHISDPTFYNTLYC
jgi:hypothetical protein